MTATVVHFQFCGQNDSMEPHIRKSFTDLGIQLTCAEIGASGAQCGIFCFSRFDEDLFKAIRAIVISRIPTCLRLQATNSVLKNGDAWRLLLTH